MTDTIGVGLIGFGLAGQTFHAPFIANVQGLELKKIRTTNKADIAKAQQLYPKAEIVAESSALYADESIQLIVVASPNPLHFALAKEALLAGKHVVIDKPFTVTTAEADELIALSVKQGKLLSVYQNRRWDSDFKTVKKIIESGLLGDLVEYEARFDRFRNFIKPNTWKEEDQPGSGLLYDLGPHLIDQALCLFGLPEEVTGEVRVQRKYSSIVDNFTVLLHYPRLKVTLKAGMLVRGDGPRYMLYGDQGSFVKHGLDVQEEALKAGKLPGNSPAWGAEPEAIWGTLDTTYKGLELKGKIKSETGDYTGFYKNVYRAILSEEKLEVKPQQARETIRVIELAMQSSNEKRTLKFS